MSQRDSRDRGRSERTGEGATRRAPGRPKRRSSRSGGPPASVSASAGRGRSAPRSFGSQALRLSQWALYGVLALGAFEVFARVDDWFREEAPLFKPYSINTLFESAYHGRQGRPTARFAKWSMNSQGIRGPEPQPDRVNVLAYGASETFGLFETAGQEYPRQLEQVLNAARPAHFNVLNLGLPGLRVGRTEYLREAVERFQARYVFIYPSPAAYIGAERPLCGQTPSPSPPVLGIVDRSRAAGKIQTFLKRTLPSGVSTWLRRLGIMWASRGQTIMRSVPESSMTAFAADITCAVAVARRGGAVPILGTHANWFRGQSARESRSMLVAWRSFYPDLSERGFIDLEDRGNAVIRRVAQETGTPLVDAARAIPGGDGQFADFVHFTDKGAEAMAAAIAPRILELEQRRIGAGERHSAAPVPLGPPG